VFDYKTAEQLVSDGRTDDVLRFVASLHWRIGDEVVSSGAKGMLFESRLTPDGTNLVLYTDHLDFADRLDVYDPHNALPRNQSSWD
jgi:RES domain-containing protein